MNEEELKSLFEFIKSEGHLPGSGQNIHTYPSGDPNQELLYAGCAELERRGLLIRHVDEPNHVCWNIKHFRIINIAEVGYESATKLAVYNEYGEIALIL